jgi:hypothetical protein
MPGWIAAAGALIEDEGIPVVVLFPEIEFDQAKFTARVDALVKQHGFCTVIVSEGCHHPTAPSWPSRAARTPSAMRNWVARRRSSPAW